MKYLEFLYKYRYYNACSLQHFNDLVLRAQLQLQLSNPYDKKEHLYYKFHTFFYLHVVETGISQSKVFFSQFVKNGDDRSVMLATLHPSSIVKLNYRSSNLLCSTGSPDLIAYDFIKWALLLYIFMIEPNIYLSMTEDWCWHLLKERV